MAFSPAKARRFVAVVEDIVARIPSDPSKFAESQFVSMFDELNELGKPLGATDRITWFTFHTASRQIVDVSDIRSGKERELRDAYLIPRVDSSLWLHSRSRYGGMNATAVWYILPIKDGPLVGHSSKRIFLTRDKLDSFKATLREWQRWALAKVDEHAEQQGAGLPTDDGTPASDDGPLPEVIWYKGQRAYDVLSPIAKREIALQGLPPEFRHEFEVGAAAIAAARSAINVTPPLHEARLAESGADTARRVPESTEGSGAADTTPRETQSANEPQSRRGRKKLPRDETRLRNKILTEWATAQRKGIRKKDFCKNHKPPLKVKELDNYMSWRRQRDIRK